MALLRGMGRESKPERKGRRNYNVRNGTVSCAGHLWGTPGGKLNMKLKPILAVVLIAFGVFGLVYGHFNYTKETHEAKLGPIELSVKDKQSVEIPQWLSIGAIGAGVVLLLIRRGR